jgi:hypothetical protein
MDIDKLQFNKNYYNVFGVCQEFRQRLEDLQRLTKAKKQEKEEKDVK